MGVNTYQKSTKNVDLYLTKIHLLLHFIWNSRQSQNKAKISLRKKLSKENYQNYNFFKQSNLKWCKMWHSESLNSTHLKEFFESTSELQCKTWRGVPNPHVTSSFCVFRISKNRMPYLSLILLESQKIFFFQTEFVCHSPSVMFWCMLMLSRFDALFSKLFFSSSCLEGAWAPALLGHMVIV